jgi:hypothetical protein
MTAERGNNEEEQTTKAQFICSDFTLFFYLIILFTRVKSNGESE